MRFIIWQLVFLTLVFTACSGKATPLPEAQILTRVWQALEPNSSSHSQANWEVVESRSVSGREVSERFAGGPDPGCVPGPTPPSYQPITPTSTYWHVEMRPRPATPLPGTPISPTAPPRIPEATVYQADFLVDPSTGEIIARKFGVLYTDKRRKVRLQVGDWFIVWQRVYCYAFFDLEAQLEQHDE